MLFGSRLGSFGCETVRTTKSDEMDGGPAPSSLGVRLPHCGVGEAAGGLAVVASLRGLYPLRPPLRSRDQLSRGPPPALRRD